MSNNKNILFLREEYGDGQGTFTSLEGDKYVGKWKNGEKWNGTQYDKDGNITKKYVNGELQE